MSIKVTAKSAPILITRKPRISSRKVFSTIGRVKVWARETAQLNDQLVNASYRRALQDVANAIHNLERFI